MTLTNYWWLLIWLALAGGLLAVAVPKKPVQVLGKTEYRWSWGAALVLACPYVIWAANRVNFGDTEVYRKTFRDIPTLGGPLTSYLSEHGKDQGFTVLVSVIKTLIGSNDKLFFFLIAAFQMFCIIYFLRKYSTSFLLSDIHVRNFYRLLVLDVQRYAAIYRRLHCPLEFWIGFEEEVHSCRSRYSAGFNDPCVSIDHDPVDLCDARAVMELENASPVGWRGDSYLAD